MSSTEPDRFGGYGSEEAELAAHPPTDDEYWRAKFVALVNQTRSGSDGLAELIRGALTKVLGHDGPVS